MIPPTAGEIIVAAGAARAFRRAVRRLARRRWRPATRVHIEKTGGYAGRAENKVTLKKRSGFAEKGQRFRSLGL